MKWKIAKKKNYTNSKRYKIMIKEISKILIEKTLEKKSENN